MRIINWQGDPARLRIPSYETPLPGRVNQLLWIGTAYVQAKFHKLEQAGTTGIVWFGNAEGEEVKESIGAMTGWMEFVYPDLDPKPADPYGTHPVDRKPANPFGLLGMLGNLPEYTQDRWTPRLPAGPARDPINDKGLHRVLRGGGWAYQNWCMLNSAARMPMPEDIGDHYTGFRVVRVVE